MDNRELLYLINQILGITAFLFTWLVMFLAYKKINKRFDKLINENNFERHVLQ